MQFGLFAGKGLDPLFFFFSPTKGNHAIKGACFHAAEAQATGSRHFVVLFADVNEERANLFGNTFFALPTFCFVKTNPPKAAVAGQDPVGRNPAEKAA